MKLRHFEDTNGDGVNDEWINRTATLDTAANIICAVVTSLSAFAIFEPANQSPSVAADQPTVEVNEGQTAKNTGTISDPDGDPVTLSASVGSVSNNDGTWSWSFTSLDEAESQTVTISGADGNGGTASVDFALVVNNVAPAVGPVVVPTEPVNVNDQPVSASATFSDPAGAVDAHSCTVDYGDGPGPQAGTVSGTTCTGPDQTYAGPGVYEVTVAVTDKDGGTGSATATQFIVIYDPEDGFVAGGGWIDSPAEACPTFYGGASGKANFGFVSKYKKGATTPTGQTQFPETGRRIIVIHTKYTNWTFSVSTSGAARRYAFNSLLQVGKRFSEHRRRR